MTKGAFMDEVHRATYKGISSPETPKHSQTLKVLREYRTLLRQAHKFVIDDDAVRLATHLTQGDTKFHTWSSLARLPYDCVWMEYNFEVKMEIYAKSGMHIEYNKPSECHPIVGLLLRKDHPSTTRWIAQEFYKFDDVIDERCLTIVFDPEGTEHSPARGSTLLGRQTVSEDGWPKVPITVCTMGAEWAGVPFKERPRRTIMVNLEAALAGETAFNKDYTQVGLPEWVVDKVGAVVSPFWAASLKLAKPDMAAIAHERFRRDAIDESVKRGSSLRWIVALLASINEAPTHTRPVTPRTGTMSVGSHNLPYFRHSTIHINIPKRGSPVRSIARILDHVAARRPRHEVRGHWRCVDYGKAIRCDHAPTMVENGVGICTRCERLIRWLPSFERGDASLGWVRHEYSVHGRSVRTYREPPELRPQPPRGEPSQQG